MHEIEDGILACWGVVEDLEYLGHTEVARLYDLKFQKLMEAYEHNLAQFAEIYALLEEHSLANADTTTHQSVEYSEDWQPSKRDWAIAQNGNIGYDDDSI